MFDVNLPHMPLRSPASEARKIAFQITICELRKHEVVRQLHECGRDFFRCPTRVNGRQSNRGHDVVRGFLTPQETVGMPVGGRGRDMVHGGELSCPISASRDLSCERRRHLRETIACSSTLLARPDLADGCFRLPVRREAHALVVSLGDSVRVAYESFDFRQSRTDRNLLTRRE